MSAYESMGGGLKLKGMDNGIAKKKKKPKKDSSKLAEAAISESKSSTDTGNGDRAAAKREVVPVVKPPSKTAAELKFEETQRKRQMDKVSKMANKSHKDRVQEYNEKLEKIPEHYDIPKVGPG